MKLTYRKAMKDDADLLIEMHYNHIDWMEWTVE